jgi:hypothetical protein
MAITFAYKKHQNLTPIQKFLQLISGNTKDNSSFIQIKSRIFYFDFENYWTNLSSPWRQGADATVATRPAFPAASLLRT